MVALLGSALALAVVVPLVAAQSAAYGQCGGTGWTGSKSCVSGYICTYSNSYYSQCLPGSSSTTKSTTTTTTKPATTTTTKSTTSPTPTTKSKVNYWFSFGDSYSTTGFMTNGTQPTVGNPLGNPAYPGITAVGGVNYVDVLTVQYNKSLVLNYNFAWSGATITRALVSPTESTILTVTDQVNEFMSSYASKPAVAPWSSSNTLFSVWIGINDIGNSYASSRGGPALNTQLITAYFALVQKLYNAGARNFLFINVPPIDRSPLRLNQSASSRAVEKPIIADYNSQLASAITKFKSSNSGATVFTWDSNTVFNQILDDPTAYGFVDATSFGKTGDFWGGDYHPSPAAHELFAKDIGTQVLEKTVW